MDNKYYVYRWIRLDTNQIFYVGRGKGNRYKQTKNGRNKYFRNIILKATCEVEIMMENLTLEESCAKEIEFIKLYKDIGQCVANMSSGGESGNAGIIQSEETRLKKSIRFKGESNPMFGKTHNQEAREKISAANKSKKISEATKAKISEANKGEKNSFFGKNHSIESKAKISAARIGKKHSTEIKKKMSEARKGDNHPRAKKVVDIVTGKIFGCMGAAATFFNMNYSTLNSILNSGDRNKTTLRYLTTERI